jgi:hypothetical protein
MFAGQLSNPRISGIGFRQCDHGFFLAVQSLPRRDSAVIMILIQPKP